MDPRISHARLRRREAPVAAGDATGAGVTAATAGAWGAPVRADRGTFSSLP